MKWLRKLLGESPEVDRLRQTVASLTHERNEASRLMQEAHLELEEERLAHKRTDDVRRTQLEGYAALGKKNIELNAAHAKTSQELDDLRAAMLLMQGAAAKALAVGGGQ